LVFGIGMGQFKKKSLKIPKG